MKFWKHLKTITYHKWLVMKGFFRIGLYRQGLLHDMSKYSPAEFLVGCKYFQGNMSPNNVERLDKGYSSAWLHHKGRNRHHFEYWNDYNPKTKRMEPVEMPVRFLAEMFCDRVAASKIYLKEKYLPDEPLHYFQNSTAQKRGLLHPSTAKALTDLLTILAEEGEDRAFSVLRQMVKSDAHSRKSR